MGLMVQCRRCAVTVSQTKIGVCLQFEWLLHDPAASSKWPRWPSDRRSVYCSVDLVPAFNVEPINCIELARIVNSAMLFTERRPRGWVQQLNGYARADMVFCNAADSGSPVKSVFLKLLNSSDDKYYYIRPGQCLSENKFRTDTLQLAYLFIKALKKSLGVEIDLYMVKKLFQTHSYVVSSSGCLTTGEVIFRVLTRPELKNKFARHVDFDRWERMRPELIRRRPIPLIKK